MTKSVTSETCQRYLVKKGLCGKPVFQGFIIKTYSGSIVRTVLCEKHSGDEGVRRVK